MEPPAPPQTVTPPSVLPAYHQSQHVEDGIETQIQGSVELGGEFGDVIMKVSALVDKYWTGSRSLLRNQRFKGNAAE